MRKRLIVLLLLSCVILLTSCDKNNENDSFHELKMTYVALNTDNELTLLKSFPLLMGERQLKYLFLIPNENVAVFRDLSGPENFVYNFSYIVNLPAKLYRNIQFDLSVSGETEAKIVQSSKFDKAIKVVSTGYLIFWDIISSIIGLVLSIVMLFIGTLFGLILHPIKSITTLIPSLIGIVTTIYSAVMNFKKW